MKATSARRKCKRVGIWCDYNGTLEASEGIGVFAHNLARGVARLPDGPQVALCIRPGDEHLVADTVAHGQGRIEIAAPPRPSYWARFYRRHLKRWTRRCEWLTQRIAPRLTRVESRVERLTARIRTPKSTTPLLLIPLLSAVTLARLLPNLALRFGLRLLSALARRASAELEHRKTNDGNEAQAIIESCDVWLIPYVGLDVKFTRPTVVTIHDLVFCHYPETVPAKHLPQLRDLVTRVAHQSTVAACMSQFIRQNDLVGVLGLGEEKIRVVRPAAPRDFGSPGDLDQASRKYPVLRQKFIFYPAAFRAYKNHSALVDALRLVHDAGSDELQLVFTGIHETPAPLGKLIASLGLSDHVHILGKVEREHLAVFYRHAQATIVPSHYEQGSFPIMEAIHWGCPVACSRIPSLVELFAPMANAMLFFDPNSPRELADTIRHICRQRDETVASQQSASQKMFERTWTDAAHDWLAVFQDAITMHRGAAPTERSLASARVAASHRAA
jgi:glycosyltransferase involved in cell wall biosynthesis